MLRGQSSPPHVGRRSRGGAWERLREGLEGMLSIQPYARESRRFSFCCWIRESSCCSGRQTARVLLCGQPFQPAPPRVGTGSGSRVRQTRLCDCGYWPCGLLDRISAAICRQSARKRVHCLQCNFLSA